jgi:chromosome segregation ATPase
MDFYSTMQGNNNTNLKSLNSSNTPSKSVMTSIAEDTEAGIHGRMQQQRVDALMEHSAKLQKHNTTLQQQNSSLKDAIDTLTKSAQATEGELREKVKLQAQLHADHIKTLQVKDRTLTERCQTLSAFAEQHRLASLKHEQKHKSLTQELQSMAAVQVAGEGRHRTAMEEVKRLQSAVKSKDQEMRSMQQGISDLQADMRTLKTELQQKDQKLDCLSGRLQQLGALLKASPYSATSNDTTAHSLQSLKSSAEVMQLAHANGGVDSMRECLGQVSAVLEDLHGELHGELLGQHCLAAEWQQRVDALGV